MAPFYRWGSTASRLESLWGGSLLFSTKFPEISGTHFTDLRRMKRWVNLGATQWFWTRDPWIRKSSALTTRPLLQILVALSGGKQSWGHNFIFIQTIFYTFQIIFHAETWPNLKCKIQKVLNKCSNLTNFLNPSAKSRNFCLEKRFSYNYRKNNFSYLCKKLKPLIWQMPDSFYIW